MRLPADSPSWDLTLPAEDGAPVISLPTFSKWGPELERAVGPGTSLVMCGVATDCCVLATAYAAADSGRSVTVVSDACAGATDDAHEQAIALLGMLDPMIVIRPSLEM